MPHLKTAPCKSPKPGLLRSSQPLLYPYGLAITAHGLTSLLTPSTTSSSEKTCFVTQKSRAIVEASKHCKAESSVQFSVIATSYFVFNNLPSCFHPCLSWFGMCTGASQASLRLRSRLCHLRLTARLETGSFGLYFDVINIACWDRVRWKKSLSQSRSQERFHILPRARTYTTSKS